MDESFKEATQKLIYLAPEVGMGPGYCPGKFSVPGTRVPDFSVPGTVPSVPVLCPHQKLCPDPSPGPENPGPESGIPGTLVSDADLWIELM